MLTVSLLLLLAAFVAIVAHLIGRAPLWITVLLLVVWALLSVLPR